MAGNEQKCGCKGIRTCLLCENPESTSVDPVAEGKKYTYCHLCQKAWSVSGPVEEEQTHPNHHGDSFDFPGIFLQYEFITEDEECMITEKIDETPWAVSQSGRRKQDYGPKVNFKKKKIRSGCFTGLPAFSREIYERMKRLEILHHFLPVELCNLEYVPDRGSAIDPHFDDFWLWGERLVTLNTLSATVLTMTHDEKPGVEVAILMPPRSLIVVYGPARYEWKHGINRGDVKSRRLATTIRELTPEFLEGGPRESEGSHLIDVALTFNGVAVGAQS